MHVLVVDDDIGILSVVRRGLIYEGYTVDSAESGVEALDIARERPPDLVILDLKLPDVDGIEVCRRLRAVGPVPIVMLTARDTVSDRVLGLDSGADDYIVKPFAFPELLARLRALRRRLDTAPPTELRFANLVYDQDAREASRGGKRVELTATELLLLELFIRHPRQVLTRELIYQRVWGYDSPADSNLIDVHVGRLRQKLEADEQPRLIQTVRGLGYALREK